MAGARRNHETWQRPRSLRWLAGLVTAVSLFLATLGVAAGPASATTIGQPLAWGSDSSGQLGCGSHSLAVVTIS
jgi:hypothetical protein